MSELVGTDILIPDFLHRLGTHSCPIGRLGSSEVAIKSCREYPVRVPPDEGLSVTGRNPHRVAEKPQVGMKSMVENKEEGKEEYDSPYGTGSVTSESAPVDSATTHNTKGDLETQLSALTSRIVILRLTKPTETVVGRIVFVGNDFVALENPITMKIRGFQATRVLEYRTDQPTEMQKDDPKNESKDVTADAGRDDPYDWKSDEEVNSLLRKKRVFDGPYEIKWYLEDHGVRVLDTYWTLDFPPHFRVDVDGTYYQLTGESREALEAVAVHIHSSLPKTHKSVWHFNVDLFKLGPPGW